MKLTMREWAELDAIAWFMKAPINQRRGYATHGANNPELKKLTALRYIRWTSKNRLRITREGYAALASKSERFLKRADQIGQRDYEGEQPWSAPDVAMDAG